ncbi:hypothetical protein EDM80_10755 [bacterium]|nr:MAG: hypothetical protein EDM80_10755 [bacterium]RIK61089.1 MAG: hypothetical protein DCC64_13820 [Planctomycetota bacterium]
MAIEYLVIERIVSAHERHPEDRANPGFSGGESETMMLRNYGLQGWKLVTVISEPVSHDNSRRVFYLMREVA